MADIARYLALVTSEYADKPNFMALLTAILAKIDDSTAAASSFLDSFDLDTATGSQLDLLGMLAGVGRTVDFQPTGGISPVLDDNTYRLALRAKVARNGWDGTITGVQTIWTQLFGAVPIYLVVKDNQDMTMSAVVIGMTDTIQADLASHGYFVPKPEGVTLLISVPANKVFAYGIDNTAFGGYGEGYWIEYSGL